jgi:hypothetical protein
LNTTLNITADGVVLVGPGRGVLGIVWTGTGIAVQFGTSGTYRYRCGIQGLRITDSSGGTGTVGLELFVRESVFTDTFIHQGFTSTQLRVNGTTAPAAGCWSCRFVNCYISNGTGDGAQVFAQSNAVTFMGCQFASAAGDNVYIPITNGTRFVGCQFENAGSGYEIHVSDRSGAFTSQALGLIVDDCYFELKPATAGARALMIHGTTSTRFMFTNNYVYGAAAATHAVEAGPASGSARGDLDGNFLHGITTAHCLASTPLARVFVGDHPGQSGTWPAGSALALLDNTGGGRGTSMNQSDLELLITGKLHITTELELDGPLNHDGTTAGFYGTTPVTVPTSVSPKTALEAVGLGVTLTDSQPLDSDLTTIAGLTATTDNIIQSVAGAWASRTPTQVKTALGISANFLAGSAPNLEGATGDYWAAPAARNTAVTTSGAMYCRMIFVPTNCTIDRIGAAVTVAGAGGSTVTLGVYNDDGTGKPGTLLLDAGTIDGTSATAQEITISQALVSGSRYWLAALVAGGTPTVRIDRDDIGTGVVGRHATLAAATGTTLVRQGRTKTGISGTALPSPAGTTAIGTGIIAIAVRFA